MHSSPKLGYYLPEKKLPNPIDIVLVFAQEVYIMSFGHQCYIHMHQLSQQFMKFSKIKLSIFWENATLLNGRLVVIDRCTHWTTV